MKFVRSSYLVSTFSVYCGSLVVDVFFFKQKTAYEMRISDWSSDVCSSDLARISHFWRHDLNHAFILVDIQPPDYLSIGRTGGLCRYSLHISAHRSWATWNPDILCRKPCNRIPLPDRFALLCGNPF